MNTTPMIRALAATLTGLCLTMAGPAQAQDGVATPGDHDMNLRWQGESRRVIVHLPVGAPRAALPLVLALHGGGGHAAYMADDERYGLSLTADREGFIVAYPNGHSRLPGGRFATWNAGGCCGDARDRQIDDVAFLRQVVAEVARQYPVDPQRVYATGMSNGGMMAHRLACEAADLFAAVASVAGTEAVSRCQPVRPISVLHIHALDDDHVLYQGGAGEQAFRDRDQVMDFVSVPDTVAHWAERDHCQGPAQTLWQHPDARCDVHARCAEGSVVQWCTTQTGGHSWPGAERTRRGKAAASQALSANDVIWAFFKAHPRP